MKLNFLRSLELRSHVVTRKFDLLQTIFLNNNKIGELESEGFYLGREGEVISWFMQHRVNYPENMSYRLVSLLIQLSADLLV